MQVVKRNGEWVDYDGNKIQMAIIKAMRETEIGIDEDLVIDISNKIFNKYQHDGVNLKPIPYVESIQDDIENMLMESNRKDVAKKYILYREERSQKRDKPWDMTDLQRDIYEKKYRFEGESFGEFLDRVSGGNKYIRKLIQEKKFLPAGRILANRGLNERGKKVCYSNCFVNKPPQDNLESIFQVAGDMARTYSYGGGVGISLKHLRPKGAIVNNSADETTGAVSFMDLYSTTTGLIGMRGRRGALMISLPVDHPDILDFINVKNDLSKVNYANISVMVTDDFMSAVLNNKDWEMKFQVEDTGEVISKTLPARYIFRKLAESNWKQAEPGILYWDRVNNYHLNSEVEGFEFSSTNPCGEVPLMEGSSCLLGSVNLSEYVIDPFTENPRFNINKLLEDLPEVVRFMDDLLEEGLPFLPLEYQRQSSIEKREIGIGIMGLADMLIKLGIKYGSPESLEFIDELMKEFTNTIIQASSILADERGSYPKFQKDKVLKSEFLNNIGTSNTKGLIKVFGLRNAQLVSIAPTGSISTLLGISGGVEPIFALEHNRRSQSLGDGEDIVYKVCADIVNQYFEVTGANPNDPLPDYFITSHEIDYKDRVKFQGVIQKYVDNAISSTVNLPNSATIEDIEDLYMLAWENGLKGVTVYRDGCMREGILTADSPKEVQENTTSEECST